MNASGQVVGMALVGSYPTAALHAFLYQNGTLQDLNSLIPRLSSGVLEAATAINNNGQILAGVVAPMGKDTTVLLTPIGEPAPQIPEPSTRAFFCLAASGMTVRRAWGRRRS